MQVTLRQHVAHEETVFEPGDEAVGLFPLAAFLNAEDAPVKGDVFFREDGRQRRFAVGIEDVRRQGCDLDRRRFRPRLRGRQRQHERAADEDGSDEERTADHIRSENRLPLLVTAILTIGRAQATAKQEKNPTACG